jgi:hypothetical protein
MSQDLCGFKRKKNTGNFSIEFFKILKAISILFKKIK